MEPVTARSTPTLFRKFAVIRRLERGRGQSLILVLGSLVLLSALVLALLAVRGIEFLGHYANGASVRELASSTVNLAMGLIATATKGQDSAGNTGGLGLPTWDIRTYSSAIVGSIQPGTMENAYKLYSSPTLVLSGSVSPANEAAAMANWTNKPAYFTDLMRPSPIPYRDNPITPFSIPTRPTPTPALPPLAWRDFRSAKLPTPSPAPRAVSPCPPGFPPGKCR